MSEEIQEKEAITADAIVLTSEEIKTIESLITTTNYPHDFIEALKDIKEITTERKLVLMYHFSQGHMYSAMHSFMAEALPKMMGMGASDPNLDS